jgi:hypothetical protein
MDSNWIIVVTFRISKRDALYASGICEMTPGCNVWQVAVVPLSSSPFPNCVQVVACVCIHWEMSMKIETLSHALHLMFLHLLRGKINSILVVYSNYRHLMLKLRFSRAVPPFPYMPSCCEQAQLYQYFTTATFRHKLPATEVVQRTSEMEDPFCVENWRISRELTFFALFMPV